MSPRFAALVVAVAGFASLSWEVLWVRVVGFAAAGASFAFGLLLAAYLAGLAAGAAAARRACRDPEAATRPGPLGGVSLLLIVAAAAAFLAAPAFARLATVAPWPLGLAGFALATGLLGAVLPVASHRAIPPDARAGEGLSRLYAANVAGSVAGATGTGFWLLDHLTLASTSRLLLLLVTGVALLVGPRRGRGAAPVLVGVAAAALLAALGPSLHDRLWERLWACRRWGPEVAFAEVAENRNGVVAVTADGVVYGDGTYDGVISTDLVHDRNGIVRAYALAALHPAPRDVLVIGLSMGAWTRVLADLPGLERLTAVELNPAYLALIPRHPQVAGVLVHPRVRIVVDDGRRWLRRHRDATFDAVVANTTFHWRAQATNLLSREFHEEVRAHLRPGGVYHFNTTGSPEALRTAFETWPHGLRVQGFAAVSDAPLAPDPDRWERALLAWRIDGRPVIDPARDEDRARLVALRALIARLDGPFDPDGLETREAALARLGPGPLVTDDGMVTEFPWLARFRAP